MTPMKVSTGPFTASAVGRVLVCAVLIGLSFDLIVRQQQVGLGLFVFMTLLILATVVVRKPTRPVAFALLLGALVLAAWVVIRTADYLIAIDLIVALLLLSAAASATVYDTPVWLWRLRAHFSSWLQQLKAACVGAADVIAGAYNLRRSMRLDGALPYLRGALLALPIFALFAVLLASADVVFSDFLDDIIPNAEISVNQTFQHLIWIAVVAWIAAGLLTFVLQPTPANQQAAEPVADASEFLAVLPKVPTVKRRQATGYVETMVVLCSVAALFALFVAFQLPYLFGGAKQIAIPGVTYAQYAREGFFQLLAVAVLTVALIWVALTTVGPVEGRKSLGFRVVCTVMIVLTAVMLASALKRLGLYEDAYGFTRMRLLSHVFAFLVAGVLLLLAVQVFRRDQPLLLSGCVALGFITVFGLNAINPDAYIAKHNLQRTLTKPQTLKASTENDSFDAWWEADVFYATELSADAVPTVLDVLAPVPMHAQTNIRRSVAAWYCSSVARASGPPEWNLGRTRARAALRRHGFNPTTRCPLVALNVREHGGLDTVEYDW